MRQGEEHRGGGGLDLAQRGRVATPRGADAGHLMRMNESDPRLIHSFQTISQTTCTAVLLAGCLIAAGMIETEKRR